MQKRQKPLLFLMLLASLLPLFSFSTAATTVNPLSVSAKSAVLIEAESAEIVYAKNANTMLPMASTTKIMTALTALKLAKLSDKICVDARAVGVEGSSIYLVEGEILTLEELLYALLLESANDAAVAIAIGVSGSVDAFCDEMNRMAKELGLVQTHFTNPHGLDDEEHYTTAYELALIARSLLKNEALKKIVSTQKTTVSHDGTAHARLMVNHNKLLRTYEGCIGIKTGFTKRSGRCLVSAAKRNGVCLIAVTLNAPDDWRDHTALFDCGFSQYRSVLLCTSGEYQIMLPVVGGTGGECVITNPNELRITLPNRPVTVTSSIELPRFVYAPVTTDEVIGKAVFFADLDGDGIKEKIAETQLSATQTIDQPPREKSWLDRLIDFFKNLFSF